MDVQGTQCPDIEIVVILLVKRYNLQLNKGCRAPWPGSVYSMRLIFGSRGMTLRNLPLLQVCAGSVAPKPSLLLSPLNTLQLPRALPRECCPGHFLSHQPTPRSLGPEI